MAETANKDDVEVGEKGETAIPLKNHEAREIDADDTASQEQEDKLQDITLYIMPLHIRQFKGVSKFIGSGSTLAPEKYRVSREVQHWTIQVNNTCYEVTSIYKERQKKGKDKDKVKGKEDAKEGDEEDVEDEDDEDGERLGIGLVVTPADKWWRHKKKIGVAPAEWGVVGKASKGKKELDEEADWIWTSFKKSSRWSYKPLTKNCHMFAYLFVARVAAVKAAKEHKNKLEKWWKNEQNHRDAREGRDPPKEDAGAHPRRDRIIHRMPLPVSHTLTELCAAAFSVGLSSSIHQVVGSQLPVLASAQGMTATTTILGTSAGTAGSAQVGTAGAVGSAKATTVATAGVAKGGVAAGGAKATAIAGTGAAKGGVAAAGGKAAVAGLGASKMAAAGATVSSVGKGAMFVHPVAGAATAVGGAGLVYFGNRRRKKMLERVEKNAQKVGGGQAGDVKVEEVQAVENGEDGEEKVVVEIAEDGSIGEETTDAETDSTAGTDIEVSPEAEALAAEIEKELQADLEEKQLALEKNEEAGSDAEDNICAGKGEERKLTAEPENYAETEGAGENEAVVASRSDTKSPSSSTSSEKTNGTSGSVSTAATSVTGSTSSSVGPGDRNDSNASEFAKQARDELFSRGKKLLARGNEKRLAFRNARTASNS